MNFPLVQAVVRSDLSSSQRLIMLLMLNHADSGGRAWPSHATLARESGLSERSVWAHVNALEQSGWLVKVGSHYRVAVFQVANPAESAASIPQNLRDADEPIPQILRDDPANTSAHPANIAVSSRNGCGLTTQEPLNHNYPRTTHMETARPSQRVEEVEHLKKQCSSKAKAESKPPKPKLKPAQADWREWNQRQAEEANAVALAPHMPPDFHAAWQGWQAYRTRRATEARIASEAIPWTSDAAQAALRECERAANTHGWPALIARIDQAISGNWQGLNTDKITPTRPQSPAPASQRSDTANRPGRYATPPPTVESIMSRSHRLPVTSRTAPPPPPTTAHAPTDTAPDEPVSGSAYFFSQLNSPSRHQPSPHHRHDHGGSSTTITA